MVAVADGLLWLYALNPMNPWVALRGQLVGSALAALCLFGAIFRRRAWARYVLIMLLGFVIAVFSGSYLFLVNRPDRIAHLPLAELLAGLLLHAGAIALLVRSRGIAHLARPSGSGG